MASRYRANGYKLRRKSAKDSVGEEREISNSLNFAIDGDEIDSDLPVPKLSFTVASVVVFCVSVLCYFNSCKGDFVFDDSEAIEGNKDLNPDIPLGKLFLHDFWGTNISSNTSHKSYRPLTILTFRFNYWLAGGLKPWGFHLLNVILHAAVSVLCLRLFSILVSGRNKITFYYDNATTRTRFPAPKASFVCALLFAVHPIHTESVSTNNSSVLSTVNFISLTLDSEKFGNFDS